MSLFNGGKSGPLCEFLGVGGVLFRSVLFSLYVAHTSRFVALGLEFSLYLDLIISI